MNVHVEAPKPPAKAPEKTTAPPAPDPKPVSAGPTGPAGDEQFGDVFAEIDRLDKADSAKAPEPKKQAKEQPKQETQDEETPKDEVVEKADEKPAEKQDDKPEQFTKAADLRKAYDEKKKALKASETRISELQTALDEAKRTPPPDPEKPALVEKLTATEKRLKTLEDEIKFLNYAKSEEFVKTYQKPYEEAWQSAVSDLNELAIEGEDGTTRKATIQDLLALSQMPLGEARKAANSMFGDAADDVMAHRRKILDLHKAQQKALEDAKANAGEREAAMKSKQEEQRSKVNAAWSTENKRLKDKYPAWFLPEEGDTDGNSLLQKGYDMVQQAFAGNNGDPEKAALLHARIANQAAAFPRQTYRLNKANAKIKELEAELAAFQSSEPKPGKEKAPSSPAYKSMMEEVEAEIDAADKAGD